MAEWQYANTYAPWETPNGNTGSNPSFGGYGQVGESAGPWDAFNPTKWSSDMFSMDAQTSANGMGLGWWDFKGGKKRSSPNFTAPSYQGTYFMPQEGLPDWYTNGDTSDDYLGSSYQGLIQNQMVTNQQAQSQQPLSQPQQPETQAQTGYGYNPYDTYSGYNNYSGGAGGSYVPQMGGYSYGGGYGSTGQSGAQPQQNSPYQPFVPTGYQGGQY